MTPHHARWPRRTFKRYGEWQGINCAVVRLLGPYGDESFQDRETAEQTDKPCTAALVAYWKKRRISSAMMCTVRHDNIQNETHTPEQPLPYV